MNPESTGIALEAKMAKFIQENPKALESKDAWGLFELGFDLGDLRPTWAQAQSTFQNLKHPIK